MRFVSDSKQLLLFIVKMMIRKKSLTVKTITAFHLHVASAIRSCAKEIDIYSTPGKNEHCSAAENPAVSDRRMGIK